ncbi:MAG: hypothetical protein M3680_16970 [Myxococcota bacterium]|nr:hypothetical protein [Myxococcota bacterium]
MKRVTSIVALLLFARTADAKDVFEVCKGESRTAVAGTGRISIAVVYPSDFPVTTTPQMRNAIGAQLAKIEKAKIVPAKDVERAKTLVGEKKWSDKSDVCGYAPSLVAVLGLKHPNLSTAHAAIACEGTTCELRVDLERHGRPTAERWVRYVAPLAGAKDQVKTIQAAAVKLDAKGAPPDVPTTGLAVKELPSGKVTVRSDVDGALETDRTIEASTAVAACAPKNRKAHDVRGYFAEWMLSAKGNPYQVMVKPFAGRDPADAKAAECLKKAFEATQLACPRDGKPVAVKTAVCL